jgi:pimeloyl-ACP methyl ester carboxylesterase
VSARAIRVDAGRALSWEERGDRAGVPVVFHHGTPGSRRNRHPDPGFYERHGIRMITYDRPGYGESDPQPERRVVDAVGDTRALADELELARFAVAGGSGGGPHALACAALLGDRVTCAAIVVGVGPSDDPEFDFLQGMSPSNVDEFEAARRGRASLQAFLETYGDMSEDPLAPFDAIAHELPEPDQAILRRDEFREVTRDAAREAARQGFEGWIEDMMAFTRPWGFALDDVRVPVRLWQGELDVLAPRHHADYLAANVPGAELEVVPGVGHLFVDELARVYDWVASMSR